MPRPVGGVTGGDVGSARRPRHGPPAPAAPVRDVFIVCDNAEELGGLQRWVHHIAGLLSSRGHRVHVVGIMHADVPHDYGAERPYPVTVLHGSRPPARRGRGARRGIAERRRADAVRGGAARLSALLRSARPGGIVIVAQVLAMEWVAMTDTPLPVVGMSHESYAATRGSSRYARVRRHFADVDRLLLLTAEDADAWAREGMSNVDVMPNPLHVSPSASSASTEPVVVRLGRLSYDKGQDMLLEAWAVLASRHSDWRLRLYGSGPEERELRDLAARLGVSASVEFPGPTADLEAALTGASVFALSSREEGFPMSVMEAMAYGLPTVAFDCAPGVRELLTHEADGLLVTPGDVVGFAAAVERLMDDPGLRTRMGEVARVSVRRFAADRIVDRWERLFAFLYR